jgi:predicted O-linked N-acetylglucosamine transferase (SPINDLY family)
LERAQDLHRRGYLPEAALLYREILQRSPRHAAALNSLGILCAQQGDKESALEWIGKAVAVESRSAAYLVNYGKALLQLGRAVDACEALERAASFDSGYAPAYHELGLARGESGYLEGAEAAFREALSLEPGSWEVHSDLGLLLHRVGRHEEAVQSLRRAVEMEPRSVDALRNLGLVLRVQRRAAEAVETYRAALALQPKDPATLSNLGNALLDLSNREEAAACFREALALAPGHADAHHNWGLLHLRSGELQRASEKFRAALAINPRLGESEKGLASALHDLGRIDEAIAAARRAMVLRPQDRDVHSQLLFSLLHSPDVGMREIFEEHRGWARRHASGFSLSTSYENPPEPERRLRVGYVSGDFRQHSVALFLGPVLPEHDRDRFEVTCYYNLDIADETTERLRQHADRWRVIASLADDEVAVMVRNDGIDVLVDLSGHTQHNRLLVFARRPAPVQVAWLGYAETTGVEAIQYRISDAITDPPGNEAFSAEALLRLPDGFHCYEPPIDAPPVEPAPSSGTGYVTFASFNTLAKANSKVFEQWRRILAAVPRSRLFIKALSLADPDTRAACIERLVAEGIPPDRLECAPGTRTRAEHLAAYHRVDIALDTFPYNGTTTTCEALWMGVPVVTLVGDRHAGRVSASLLTQMHLEDLVARAPDEYVATAIALARDPSRRSALRAGMRERMRASSLMDAKRRTRNLEQAYRSAWLRWCESQGGGARR